MIMRICLVMFVLFPFVSFAKSVATAKKAVEKSLARKLTPAEETEIKDLAKTYVDAFEKRDLLRLKTVVTDNFLELIGGEAAVKERFSKQEVNVGAKQDPKKESGAKLSASVLSENENHYVHVGPKTDPDETEGMWFRVVKVGAKWKLDAPAPDFAK